MELNLRKARKLESKIQSHLDATSLDVTTSVRLLGTLDEAKKTVEDSKSEALKGLLTRETLLRLRYDIRRQIEEKNEVSGINKLINEKVVTDKLYRELSSLSTSSAFSEIELEDQLKANSAHLGMTTDETDIFSRRPKNSTVKTTIKISVLNKTDLENLESKKADYKKALEDLEDSINQKNLSNNVVLSEDTTKLLQSYRLI